MSLIGRELLLAMALLVQRFRSRGLDVIIPMTQRDTYLMLIF